MLSYGPPWKLAVMGAVSVIAGIALLIVNWQLAELAAFVAMLFIARGALHVVTTSLEGVTGALSAIQGGGELAVGLLLLAWPHPTLLVLTVVVGVLVLLEGTVDATVVLTSRAEIAHWQYRLGADLGANALAIALIARPAGTVHGAAVTLGLIAVLAGVVEVATAVSRQRRHTVTIEAVVVA
jgi:uncharacterized membrane protein HdeD (DUF308 family)